MKGSQVGWSEVLLNVLGYHIDVDPCPIMILQPNLEMAEAFSKDRIATMIRDCPTLRDKVSDPRSRDGDNKLRHKSFPGGHVTLVGANSPAGLASRPIRILLADEIDRYSESAGAEGDPLKLAAKRQTTFWNRKTLLGGTPTIKDSSIIAREWERSDKRRFFVPCPHCGEEQFLAWRNVRWQSVKREEVEERPEGSIESRSAYHFPETAAYHCEECGAGWNDAERGEAVSVGTWRATAPFRGMAGFHIPGLISPWLSLEMIVREFLDAGHDPELLKVWTNTVLGDVFEEKGVTVDEGSLLSRVENYDSLSLPNEVRLVTCGVDTQDDRLEIQWTAWGTKEEAWPCRFEVVRGDPSQDFVWNQLDELLRERLETQDGRTIFPAAACVDMGGHHGQSVLDFCNRRRRMNVFATFGVSGTKPVWPKKATKSKVGARLAYGICVDTAKGTIYSRLEHVKEPGPGYIHFPNADGFDATYFEQLTAEKRVTRYKEGRPYHVWTLKKQGARNEALDCFVYSFAALKSFPARLDVPPAPIGRPPVARTVNREGVGEGPPPPPVETPDRRERGGFRKRQERGTWLTRRNGWIR